LLSDGSPVKIRFNDRNELDPQHIAIAGMAGSGKTELMKDILYQINQKSDGELKFIFFDYKGEGQSGQLKSFLDATNCEFVDIKEKAFKFNPLSYVNIANERARDGHIKMFRDAVLAIDKRMGAKQRNYLETVLRDCFEKSKRTGKHPNINDVRLELNQYYEDNRISLDTLTSVMDELSGSNMTVFEDAENTEKLSDKNVYLSLPSTLGKMARQAIVFMILNYIFAEFIDTNDVQIQENGIKPMRYVVVIDEAHNFLGSVNMREILEKMLREIRSKGVSVMMISQGMEDYKQQGFDFASQVKLPILLNVQNKNMNVAKYFLGTPRSEAILAKALQSLEPKRAIINMKEPQLLEIAQFWQRKNL
jgi:DNA sulfur modification protein DndE